MVFRFAYPNPAPDGEVHTIGPWIDGGQIGDGRLIYGGGHSIAVTYLSDVNPNSVADTNLTITAPELLDALRDMVATFRRCTGVLEQIAMAKAIMAIARAEGNLDHISDNLDCSDFEDFPATVRKFLARKRLIYVFPNESGEI